MQLNVNFYTNFPDDCALSPCALNATCIDGVNDFTCDCPPGFRGKRCEIKNQLCHDDPCVHGKCVDRMYEFQCVCEDGWSGIINFIICDTSMEIVCFSHVYANRDKCNNSQLIEHMAAVLLSSHVLGERRA